nr:polysaccharide deacetylase family protein [Streptomyces sp. TP-A0874]
MALGAAALLLISLVSAGCAAGESSASLENAAPGRLSDPARDLAAGTERLRRSEAARLAVARKWGLDRPPLLPPDPPAVKPTPSTPTYLQRSGSDEGGAVPAGLPVVVNQVPTTDRVVFLTIDDGDHKDPELLQMLSELQVPVSAFLTHSEARSDYGYFRQLRRLGMGVNNHTLNHRQLSALPYAEQRREICGQQENLEREIGVRPELFRPPYGDYNLDTLRAAASCGVKVLPLWTEEAFPDRMEYAEAGGRLLPGDIILTHFRGPADWRGTMPDVVRRVLRTATEQGFAVARIEDYL